MTTLKLATGNRIFSKTRKLLDYLFVYIQVMIDQKKV
jgi:hypothetical protein